MTGIPQDDDNGFVNAAMQRGIDMEGAAIEAYEAATGALVRRTGFISHDELAAGCSLDGDIDDCTGILEVKCPKSATHLATVRSGAVPSSYLPQITHNLWVTGAVVVRFRQLRRPVPAGTVAHHHPSAARRGRSRGL